MPSIRDPLKFDSDPADTYRRMITRFLERVKSRGPTTRQNPETVVRITSNAIQQETLAAIRNSMSGMAEAQRRVTTGKRVHEPSDDPVAADGILRIGRRSRALEQYARNIDQADARLRTEEMVLNEVSDLLTRAKELGIAGNTASVDQGARDAMQAEVDVLVDAAVHAANTRYGNGYLFGGDAPDQPPFDADGIRDVSLHTSGHQVDIGIGGSNWFESNHNGEEVFEDTGVLTALKDLSTALGSGDTADIGNALTSIDDAFGQVQEKLSEVGARTNRLEVARSNVEALDLNLQTLRSDLEDADIEEAVSELVGRQMAYQSALLAASKIMSTTLTDYLR